MSASKRKVTDYLECLRNAEPFVWFNEGLQPVEQVLPGRTISLKQVREAQARFYRFSPLIMDLFAEETGHTGGIIESPLINVPHLAEYLAKEANASDVVPGNVYIKADHSLPVAGSIKARGGIHEVLCLAEKIAMEHELLSYSDNYCVLRSDKVRRLFSEYTIAVGSTGNLGLSIGVMAAALGFKAVVHMSEEAKPWKKNLLRELGVQVIEHRSDYTAAVSAGRQQSEADSRTIFIDDENSIELFLGYSAAAFRLAQQLREQAHSIDTDHPVFVYLPCGVGGAPGGITFGLKLLFGDAVHCFFAEPTAAPCMALGLISGKHSEISIYDIGLDNGTDADGLAVSRPSGFVGKMIQPLLNGMFTVDDSFLYKGCAKAWELENMRLEPSAAAGFAGPGYVLGSDAGKQYLEKMNIVPANITHVLWTTGGRYVPEDEFRKCVIQAAEGDAQSEKDLFV